MDIRDVYADTVALRRRLLAALQDVPADLLERDLGTNHRSILQTLIHIMAVQQSWLDEDILGRPALDWETFKARYLGGAESLATVRRGWEEITARIRDYLLTEPDLQQVIELPYGPGRVTIEQILFHIATEEMIHLGEVLAMTRQLGIDLPAYFLLSVYQPPGAAWRRWVAEAG